MSSDMIINWLQATLRWSAPLILVSIGEVFAERSGIISMGIEGIMLAGALCGVAISFLTGSVLVAVLVTILLGIVLGSVVAFLTVSRRTNQVVTGLMFNLLAMGGTNLIFAMLSESRQTRVTTFPLLFPESWHSIPVVGPIIFQQPVSTLIALVLPLIFSVVLYKTKWGLNVRAIGDNPQAAATAGISVIKIKYQTVILSGIFAALGGCALTSRRSGIFCLRRYDGGDADL